MVLSSSLSRSADDLLVSHLSPQEPTQRRARSSSPVKNRRPLLPPSSQSFYDMRVPSMPRPHDVSTSSSTTTLSPAQIKSLSNSPISKRLHITSPSSEYVIPIPFTLQLPPKLSPRNQTPPRSAKSSGCTTPVRSPLAPDHSPNSKQTRLIYTGKTYEKLDSSDDDADGEYGDVFPPSPVPSRKPPPVVTNKRKSVKHNYQNKLLSHDELSIIEEASNSGSSRASSVKSRKIEKALPEPPQSESYKKEFKNQINAQSASKPVPKPVSKPKHPGSNQVPNQESKHQQSKNQIDAPVSKSVSTQPAPKAVSKQAVPQQTIPNHQPSNQPSKSVSLVSQVPKAVSNQRSKDGPGRAPANRYDSSSALDEKVMRDVPRLNTQSHHPHCVSNGRVVPPPLPTQPGQKHNEVEQKLGSKGKQSACLHWNNVSARSEESAHFNLQFVAPSPHVSDAHKIQDAHPLVLNPNLTKSKVPPPTANLVRPSELGVNLDMHYAANPFNKNHAMGANNRNVLKIYKRSFSDESHVSSISSFSSAGEFMNPSANPSIRTRAYAPTLVPQQGNSYNVHQGVNTLENDNLVQSENNHNMIGMSENDHNLVQSNDHNLIGMSENDRNRNLLGMSENSSASSIHSQNKELTTNASPIHSQNKELSRNASEVSSKSASSGSSESSWNSLQKSIDISIEDSLHSPANNEFEFGLKPSAKELPPLPMVEETAPLRISRNTSRKPSREVSPVKRPSEERKPYRRPPPPAFSDKIETIRPSPPAFNDKIESIRPSPPAFNDKIESIRSPPPAFSDKIDSTPKDQNTIQRIAPNKKQDESDNEGAGKRFSFPNNVHNVTNSKDIKQRNLSGHSAKSQKSRHSFVSQSSGQIEIPDLSNKSVAESFSTARTTSSFNGTTFDDINSNSGASSQTSLSTTSRTSGSKLEPIGIPTKASQQLVREQYKMMVGEDGSDSDYESAFNHAAKSKSSPDLSKETNSTTSYKSAANDLHHTRKSSASPVRHRRNKSMYGIDFESNDLPVSPSRKHSRSKSTSSTQGQLQQRESKSSMDFVINEPPKPINYEVDFKEATGNCQYSDAASTTPSVNEIYSTPNLTVNDLQKFPNLNSLNSEIRALSQAEDFKPYPDLRQVSHKTNGSNKKAPSLYSRSSHQSKASTGTAFSDAESVVIDLTEDNVDVCMIQRNDSSLSYKSITEKRNGKDVEVVLVEEDEPNNSSRDDLSSIYSKYQNSWVSRSNSTASSSSTESYASAASFDSGVSSEAQLQLKPRPATIEIYRQMQALRNANAAKGPLDNLKASRRQGSLVSNSSSNSASYHSKRIQPPSISQASRTRRPKPLASNAAHSKSSPDLNINPHSSFSKESNYFDYTAAERYDFNTFMKQRAVSRPT